MMIVTKFLRSCCSQATVGENSSKTGDDIGGIESRAHESPAERFREEARTVADEMTHEERGRSCGALPWTTTVSLSLPRSNSPIRKRLDEKPREPIAVRGPTARSPVAETVELAKPPHDQWPSSDEPRVSGVPSSPSLHARGTRPHIDDATSKPLI
jgi:hypothetical protein